MLPPPMADLVETTGAPDGFEVTTGPMLLPPPMEDLVETTGASVFDGRIVEAFEASGV